LLAAFVFPIRVYYEDTDAGGVVYHSQYLNFMERARTEWLRHFGFEQTWLKNELGVIFVVTQADISFKKPARFDDELEVQCQATKIGFSSIFFKQTIVRQSEVLIEAGIKIACVDANTFKPVAIPRLIKEKISPSLNLS
jgi:acyl-CoA thioester hydrolase